jgi:hypothetical protein
MGSIGVILDAPSMIAMSTGHAAARICGHDNLCCGRGL